MKFRRQSVIAIMLLGFAGCAAQTETTTTTTSTSTQRNSATDTSALDPSRNATMSDAMQMGPR